MAILVTDRGYLIADLCDAIRKLGYVPRATDVEGIAEHLLNKGWVLDHERRKVLKRAPRTGIDRQTPPSTPGIAGS